MTRTGASLMIAEVARLKALSEAQKEYIDNLEEACDAAQAKTARLREVLTKVDALISCTDVRMDAGPHYRFITTGQHEAALAVRSALSPDKPGETGAMGKLDRRTAVPTTSERSPVPTILGE